MPVYQALRELIQNEWHTRAELCTDENGEVEFQGYFGDYNVAVNGQDVADFHLAKTLRDTVEIRA